MQVPPGIPDPSSIKGDGPVLVKASTLRFMIEQCLKVATMNGPGVTNGPKGITIAPPPLGQRVIAKEPFGIRVRITAATQDGTNKRWKYSWTEVAKTVAGYGGWTDAAGGWTGSANLFNFIEDQNAATGTWGNGVASTNLTGTITIKPVPTGTRVKITDVVYLASGAVEYWFSYENGVDGACS